MFCYKCGAVMADDVKSCSNCGAAALANAMAGVAAPAVAPPPVQGNVPAAYAVPAFVSPQFVPAPQTDDKAVISLVLGVLSLVSFSILTGIPAIILGKTARENIRASSGRLTGESMATAGIVMGWVSVGLICVIVLFIVVAVIFALAARSHY